MVKDLIIDTIETIVGGYRRILDCTIVPPSRMKNLKDHPKLNVGSLLFATVLLMFARAFAGRPANLLDSFLLNLGIAFISIFLLFIIPTVVILLIKADMASSPASTPDIPEPTAPAEALADKLSSIGIFIWLVSLILFILDHLIGFVSAGGGLVVWLGRAIGDEHTVEIVTVLVYTAVAAVILLVRSFRSTRLPRWQRGDWVKALASILVLGGMNAVLMYLLIYVIQPDLHQ